MDRKTSLIVITGPTGSGKTGIALELARSYPLEAVSADSMQVYRHMDIATAKPLPEERLKLPHHLIDIREPDEDFNAQMFSSTASEKISEIRSRGKIPIIVGGTGLYIKALLYGLAPAPPGSNKLRDVLKSLAHAKGSLHLWQMLCRFDPRTANNINKNDMIRIVRSLEIIFLTGKKPSAVYLEHGFSNARFNACIVCVMPERERLYESIDTRVVKMMDQGLVQETENLLDLGFDPGLRSMQTLAYKHVVHYLESKIGLSEAVSRIQRDTRRYAKRQMTWMRSHHEQGSFLGPGKALSSLSGMLEHNI